MQQDMTSRVGRASLPEASKSKTRARFNRMMRVVRRAHLYAGLFMTPWVFLYGITALLFNHPDSFPDQPIAYFGPAEAKGTPLKDVPRPDVLATRVIDALNASESDKAAATPYRLVRPAEAKYNRDLFANVLGKGPGYSVRISLDQNSGTIRTRPEPPAKAPFVKAAAIKLDPPPFEPVTRALPTIFDRLRLPAEKATLQLGPDLSFLMEGRGKTWRVLYNTQAGRLSGHPEEVPPPLSLRRYLILLHVAHTFPSEFNWRWVWAVAVDLMFVSMVGWGCTGLLMWWQMKNVRRIGIVVLLASAVFATVLAIGMHQTFLS